jgi:hypothetical protein
MKKSRRKRTGKKEREKKSTPKPLQHAAPPPDNPQLRFVGEEMRRGSTGGQPGGEIADEQAEGEARAMAERRLAAIEQARKMPEPREEEQAPSKEDPD